MNVLKKVRNEISYIVKMRTQKGIGGFHRRKPVMIMKKKMMKKKAKKIGKKVGFILNMGYITVGYMTQKVIHIVEILTNLLCKVWRKIKRL